MTSRHRPADGGGSRRRDDDSCDKALYLTESSSESAATGTFLSRLSTDERNRLLKCGAAHDYAPGEFFFRQGDPHDGIHVIASGRVRSYEDLASMIGATRQWVSSIPAWFEEEGIVARDGPRFLVLDEKRLLDQSL